MVKMMNGSCAKAEFLNFSVSKHIFACFPHSWYLATDMQFYLISPLILIPLSFKSKFRFIGFFLIAALVLTHIVTSVIYSWDFLAKGLKYNNIMGLYYTMESRPWYRVAPFAMGMLLGKIVIDLPNQKFIFLKKIKFTMVSYDYNPMNRVSQTIYVSLCRITFALGLAGAIFLCVTENGYFIGKFLSWSFWVPLAKLSFCGYLVHYSVVDTFIYAQEHFMHMQSSLYLYIFCGNVFLTICLAYIAMLLFESPFTNLEKFIFK
ncbi:nose resistant to fluoxetine 6-like [Brachionus plicatilis]|uniref:Nose resistant to fluoxetine 6-like n=1 Tax=Brachionus plicatilis TaxID=10195 RepID=A0A3M7SI88_BRAPC|nr:nose resistant to fluoxetine 6-like [Brachionus plicatilis]